MNYTKETYHVYFLTTQPSVIKKLGITSFALFKRLMLIDFSFESKFLKSILACLSSNDNAVIPSTTICFTLCQQHG